MSRHGWTRNYNVGYVSKSGKSTILRNIQTQKTKDLDYHLN